LSEHVQEGVVVGVEDVVAGGFGVGDEEGVGTIVLVRGDGCRLGFRAGGGVMIGWLNVLKRFRVVRYKTEPSRTDSDIGNKISFLPPRYTSKTYSKGYH
jgi:hypothetical protein